MATERRRQQLLLGTLVVILLIAIYRMWPATSATPATTSNRQGQSSVPRAQGTQATAGDAPDVHLEALQGERPKPGSADRDLFRYKPKAAPPAPVAPRPTQPTAPATAVAAVPTGPPPPPPVPPITLKFIGVMEVPTQARKIAVLSDGRGAPFTGREGEVVDGRYRILKIGVESIDIAYADGRGRQTIRLTGQ
jgi:hypothetical protein